MNNSFYEKTIKNVYNRQDVELVNEVDRYIKLVENISFKYAVEFDDDLIKLDKLDKFNYIGFVILKKLNCLCIKLYMITLRKSLIVVIIIQITPFRNKRTI